ncbi:DUF1775 domain-containing protein [Pararhodobacter oceanensis]|uniref:YncI copper-binding domain-containing protein n=1 Tax=Pararhodobacter oceanensis TaxID=2172121 RepID=A0A2T8HQJ7_9RHOB|nr:DUF1775 domain-containing protein [Pararhodobacter oceanensis]PVH27711.1 hypothetical protein DDE20_16525 [Pararhodobacter oceanensis]
MNARKLARTRRPVNPRGSLVAYELLDAHFDQFSFRGKMTDTFAVGSTVYFPVVQECANGAERWIEIPAEGQDPHELEGPAPGVEITEPGHSH